MADDFESLRLQFQSILDNFLTLGLPREALTSLESFIELEKHCQLTTNSSVKSSKNNSVNKDDTRGILAPRRRSKSVIVFIVCLLLTVPLFVLHLSPNLGRHLVALWLMDDFDADQCLVSTDSHLADLFRPPVNCARLCHGVTGVERVNFSQLDFERFETDFAYTGRPIVVSGATVNWSAQQTFSFNYFRSLYSDDSPAMSSADDNDNCQYFAWGASEFNSLREVFQMDADRAAMKNGTKPWYFGWYVRIIAIKSYLKWDARKNVVTSAH
jgi:hypothetical protein